MLFIIIFLNGNQGKIENYEILYYTGRYNKWLIKQNKLIKKSLLGYYDILIPIRLNFVVKSVHSYFFFNNKFIWILIITIFIPLCTKYL
jgi:hypothetical protein